MQNHIYCVEKKFLQKLKMMMMYRTVYDICKFSTLNIHRYRIQLLMHMNPRPGWHHLVQNLAKFVANTKNNGYHMADDEHQLIPYKCLRCAAILIKINGFRNNLQQNIEIKSNETAYICK